MGFTVSSCYKQTRVAWEPIIPQVCSSALSARSCSQEEVVNTRITCSQALVSAVKDKGLLKDMEHLTKCVHTTILEVYHFIFLQYLPKQMHYTHQVMEKGTMLATLDHNKNIKRPQVSRPDIEKLRAPLAMLEKL